MSRDNKAYDLGSPQCWHMDFVISSMKKTGKYRKGELESSEKYSNKEIDRSCCSISANFSCIYINKMI